MHGDHVRINDLGSMQVKPCALFALLVVLFLFYPATSFASNSVLIATTSLTLSICGNAIVDPGESCDVPGETGVYSTTIAGRQCTNQCVFGPYCGDGILQTTFGEECDDGNNNNGDFCSATCTIEPAGSGGGGSSGGGSRSGGGSAREPGETQISVSGRGYPSRRVNILLDTEAVGSVQTNSSGNFEFTTEADPGTASMGFWSTDLNGTRSITFNTTFDVTQGAITNVNGILIPPTLLISDQTVDPGAVITLSGQAIPNATVELHFGNNVRVERVQAGTDGVWSLDFNTSVLSPGEYAVRARSVTGATSLRTESSFSSSLQLFLGVDGRPSTPSDLNRDGSVNLIDFSILIFWWQTNGGDSNPPADINGNGNVGLEDFSILLFNWTG